MADYTEQQYKAAAKKALANGDTSSAKRLIAKAREAGAAQTNVIEQTGSGINEGLANTLGAPVDLVSGGINMGIRGVNSLAGTDIGEIENPVGGSAQLQGLLSPFISENSPQTGAQQFARRAGQELGANAIPAAGLLAKGAGGANALSRGLGELATSARANPASYAASVAGSSLGATGGAEVANKLAPGNELAETGGRLVGGLAGGLLTSAATGAAERAAVRKDFIKSTPQADKLKLDAGKLYEKGHARGLQIKPTQTKALEMQIRAKAESKGFISPTGRIADSAPEVRSALNLMEDLTQGTIDTRQLQSLRDQLQIVAQSQTPKVSSTGVQMLKEYDAFLAKLAPEFKQANALYTRAMRGEMMDVVDDLADVKASQYSQSGKENALRSEFRALDRRIIRGKEKGLRPDQIKAVEAVSRGTPAVNAATRVGKLAPTSALSSVQHAFPYMVGNSLGGPAVGSAAAGATMGVGLLGRSVATTLQERAAELASATMRSSVPMQIAPQMSAAGMAGLLSTLADEPLKK